MKICLVFAERHPCGGAGRSLGRLATLLAGRHEVTLIDSTPERLGEATRAPLPGVREVMARPGDDLAGLSFSSEDNLYSAAVLRAIEQAYGDSGPDYLEVCDYRGRGLVPLQARRAGHPLLSGTAVGIRASLPMELVALHDRTMMQPGERRAADLEREQLRLADFLLWPGGDVLDLYRRFYADLQLPEPIRAGRPFAPSSGPPALPSRGPGEPLRILFVGRLQRLKGALNLVDACLRLPGDDWRLTMIGADTASAPLGQSVRTTIEAMCVDDPRIRIEDSIAHEELQRRWSEHDLLVLPSTVEVWPNVALEAMRAGLPILATPVGGQVEIVEPGVSGWLTDGVGSGPVGRALVALVGDREQVERVKSSGAVFERFLRLGNTESALAAYEDLSERVTGRDPSPSRKVRPEPAVGEPLVTAIIPYYHCHPYIQEGVASLLGQTHRNLEVLVVNDGSFERGDGILAEFEREPRVRVVTQLNSGQSAARNLGLEIAAGEYLAFLDADNFLEPEFVARGLAMLLCEPDLAYVTSWLRFIDPDGNELPGQPGFAPLGNRVMEEDRENWDGDMTSVIPRSVLAEFEGPFDSSCGIVSDWDLFRNLRAAGRFGAVIPERLARYRVVPESMMRAHSERTQQRSWDEVRDRKRLSRTRWTAVGSGRSGTGDSQNDRPKSERLIRANAELAAEIRKLSRGRDQRPRQTSTSAALRLSGLVEERSALAARLDAINAELQQIRAGREGLERQGEEMSREIARLSRGFSALLRRPRGRSPAS